MALVYLSQVFESIQGEGLHAGKRALLVRLAGCNLECSYCDTACARARPAIASVRLRGLPRDLSNPVECVEITDLVVALENLPGICLITGGEPLLQPDAVAALASGLRPRGIGIHLETNGTLPGSFERVRDRLDFVCMDLKPPSAVAGRNLEKEHVEFLRLLRADAAAVKVVVARETSMAELAWAVDMVAKVDRRLPFLIQPAMTSRGFDADVGLLMEAHRMACERLEDARISVQLHKVLGLP
jgi:organic radical activating enzyme